MEGLHFVVCLLFVASLSLCTPIRKRVVQSLPKHSSPTTMAFLYTGEVLTMEQMGTKFGGSSPFELMPWQPTAFATVNSFVAKVNSKSAESNLCIVCAPTGVLMTTSSGEDIGVGPKSLWWYSSDADHIYCHANNGNFVGKKALNRDVPTVVCGINTANSTGHAFPPTKLLTMHPPGL